MTMTLDYVDQRSETRRNRLTVLYVVAAFVMIGLVLFVLSQGAGFATSALALVAISLGSIWLAYRMLDDQYKATMKTDVGDVAMILAAVALSAVSFATTTFGMANFATQSSNPPVASVIQSATDLVGGQAGTGAAAPVPPTAAAVPDGSGWVGWYISLLTTFGIQIVMLFVALRLGELLVQSRGTYDEKVRAAENRDPEGLGTIWQHRAPIALALLIAIPVIWVVAGMDIGDFTLMFRNPGIMETWQRIASGVTLLSLAAVAIIAAVSFNWNAAFALFLLIAYFGTLAISSLFSFDSYYALVQDEGDEIRRRGAIVQEETSTLLQQAQQSLAGAGTALLTDPVNEATMSRVSDAVNSLEDRTDAINRAIRDNAAARIDALLEEARLSDQRIREFESQRDAEIQTALARAENATRDATNARADLAAAETALEEARRDFDQATQVVAGTLQDLAQARQRAAALPGLIAQQERFAQCELDGISAAEDPTCPEVVELAGDGPNYRIAVTRQGELGVELDRLQTTGFAALQTAINRAEADVLQARLAVTQAEGVVDRARLSVSVQPGATAAGTDTPASITATLEASVAAEVQDIREGYQISIDAEQVRRRNVPTAQQVAEVTLGDLPETLVAFRDDPGEDTFARWTETCTTVRQSLVNTAISETGDISATDLDCRDPVMASMARRADGFEAALAEFEGTAAGATRDCTSLSVGQRSAPQLAELRALVDETRICLNIANRGQDQIGGIIRELVEIESVYLSDATDIRRSVADLGRGAVFAVGAAVGAVFVDFLILVIGFLTALSRSRAGGLDPLKPNLDKVRETLIQRADSLIRGNPGEAMLRFLEYTEERNLNTSNKLDDVSRYQQLYRFTVDRERASRTSTLDHRIVVTIMAAIPLFYLRTNLEVDIEDEDGEKRKVERTGISQSVIDVIHEIAATATQTDRPSNAYEILDAPGYTSDPAVTPLRPGLGRDRSAPQIEASIAQAARRARERRERQDIAGQEARDRDTTGPHAQSEPETAKVPKPVDHSDPNAPIKPTSKKG